MMDFYKICITISLLCRPKEPNPAEFSYLIKYKTLNSLDSYTYKV